MCHIIKHFLKNKNVKGIIYGAAQIAMLLLFIITSVVKDIQMNLFFIIFFIITILLSAGSLFLWLKTPICTKNIGCEAIERTMSGYVKDLKALTREQRHDYMNVFQIIYGYLQLNKSEKAMDQIKKVIITSSNASKINNISILSISLLLEKKMREGENKGIEFFLDVESYVDNEFRSISDEKVILDDISEIIDMLINYTYKESNGVKLFIEIYEHYDKIQFAFSGNFDKELIKSKNIFQKYAVENDDGFEITFYFNNIRNLMPENTIYSNLITN